MNHRNVSILLVCILIALKVNVSGYYINEPGKLFLQDDSKIVCNQFDIIANLQGEVMSVSVNTDLPDYTVVIVSISRSYWEVGNDSEYAVDYYYEKSTIGKWRTNHNIPVSNTKWKSDLKAKQQQMSGAGIGFDVKTISNFIEVSMTVPASQPDPKFGKLNANLVGKAVNTDGLRVVRGETKIAYPLDSQSSTKSHFVSLDPLNLDVGAIYIISRETPIMSHYNPVDPIAAIEKTKYIPVGGKFKVISKTTSNNKPWYEVTGYDQSDRTIGTGWINSTALLGQNLKTSK